MSLLELLYDYFLFNPNSQQYFEAILKSPKKLRFSIFSHLESLQI